MRVLVACEFSQVVTKAFRERGHEAYSCDLLPTEGNPEWHIQDDVLKHLNDGWDMMIAHPPCTYLSRAGARWWHDNPARDLKTSEALIFVLDLWNAPINKIAIENPIGKLNSLWKEPDQKIEPYYFGEIYRKRTWLWLKNLPPLMATYIKMRKEYFIHSNCRKRKGVVSGGLKSSVTFPGIAAAMAEQWGSLARQGEQGEK